MDDPIVVDRRPGVGVGASAELQDDVPERRELLLRHQRGRRDAGLERRSELLQNRPHLLQLHRQRDVVLACEGELPRRLDAEQREIGIDPVVAPGQWPERPEHRAFDPPLQRPPSPEEGLILRKVDRAVATEGRLELAPPAHEIGGVAGELGGPVLGDRRRRPIELTGERFGRSRSR